MLIYTSLGLVPAEELEVTDHVTLNDNERTIATEWRKNGEIVRRDVWVSLLRGLEMGSAQAQL